MSGRSKSAGREGSGAELGPRELLEPLARILNISGCHPRDLKREFVRICQDLPIPERSWNPGRPAYIVDLSHAIARWYADEEYVDAAGQPIPLPLQGPEPSLSGLISRVLPKIDPNQAIQWLIELNAIRRERKRYLPTDRYLSLNRVPVAAWAHGLAAVLGMLRTMEINISAAPKERLLERMAINPRFPIRALPQFHRELKRQVGEILWRFDGDMRRKESRQSGEPVTRLCIGFYAFEDPPVTGRGRGASRRRSATPSGKRRSPGRRLRRGSSRREVL